MHAAREKNVLSSVDTTVSGACIDCCTAQTSLLPCGLGLGGRRACREWYGSAAGRIVWHHVCAVSSVLDEGARQLQVQIVKADSACAVLLMLCFGAQQKRERAHVFVASKRKLAGPLSHECGARAIAAESGTRIECLCCPGTVVIMLATDEMQGCLLCMSCQVFL
jgi:hypothetical protein